MRLRSTLNNLVLRNAIRTSTLLADKKKSNLRLHCFFVLRCVNILQSENFVWRRFIN